MSSTRREALIAGIGLAAAPALPQAAAAKEASQRGCPPSGLYWPSGVDGQRRADLGNGTYLNPIVAGDHPDPSILKDGKTYYKVSSSFVYYPGLVIWRSADLVNWTPVGPALQQPVGSVYAPDLVKHAGRYYIYFAARTLPQPPAAAGAPAAPRRKPMTNYVVHADSIAGPWSEPVDVGIDTAIDPGHVVGEDGRRYLYVSDGALVPLTDDGLKASGPPEKIYPGWKYPDEWVVETFALEGPKLIQRNGWYYMFSAEGGTAGPPTSHMVVVARSRSVRGPWENCPHNPIVRTTRVGEPWWSRGHATPVEGPAGDWWLVYHGIENGFRTLGRQMLLEPFEWTAEGWPKAKGGDLSKAMPKPAGARAAAHGVALSGDFSKDPFGARLTFFKPGPGYRNRIRLEGREMIVQGQGAGPAAASPLLMIAGDRSYAVTVELELRGSAQGGLVLFYDEKYFCGLGSDLKRFRIYDQGREPAFTPAVPAVGPKLFLRVVNDENVASFFYSADGGSWTKHTSLEVSGYNHNVAGGYLSLRPGVFASGDGEVVFRSINYRAGG